MNCRRCGNALPNGTYLCPSCGENNTQVDINKGNLSVNDLMNINNQNTGPKLDFVNDDNNVGNNALNGYNNQNFQYDKGVFNKGKIKRNIKINPKVAVIVLIVVLFVGGMYLIFGEEFKRSDLNKEQILDPSTGKAIDPGDPSTDPTNPEYYKNPDNPDDPDDPDNPDDPENPDDPDESGSSGGSGGSSGSGNSEDNRKKTLEMNGLEFSVPYKYKSFVNSKTNFMYVNDGNAAINFTIVLGQFDYIIDDISTIVDKLNEKAKKTEDHNQDDIHFSISYDDEYRVSKYVFYLFDTGIKNQKLFLIRYNDNYYYQGLLQVAEGVELNLGLKLIKDVISTAKGLDDDSDVNEIYEFNPVVFIANNILNSSVFEEHEGGEEIEHDHDHDD